MAKHNLPVEIHDLFGKANKLHGYVKEHLGEALQFALEAGEFLMAAKLAVPHGKWEAECERLFDGKLRTAQRYMQFAKHLGAIPKAHARALLMHEGTLEGAVKAAKKAAKPDPPEPEPDEPADDDSDEPIDAEFEPADEPEEPEEEAPPAKPDYGKCSADFIAAVDSGRVRITKEQIKVLSGIPAKKRREAEVAMMAGKSPAHTINPYRRAIKTLTPAEKKAMEARDQIKIWYDTIGRWLGKSVSIDEIREQFPGTQGDRVVKQATQFFESLKKWEKVVK